MTKRGIIKFVGGCMVMVLLAVWQHASLLEAYGSFFRKDNATLGADAIILLSAPKYARLKHALELGRDGFSPEIYVTTTPKPVLLEVLGLKYPSRMEWIAAVSKHLEIETPLAELPTSGDGVRSTFDEAYDALAWSKKNNYTRIIIVTNAFHSRRAHYAFEKVFRGSGITVEVAAAPDPGYSQSNWWLIDSGLAAYLTEPLKLMAYMIFDHSPKFIENH